MSKHSVANKTVIAIVTWNNENEIAGCLQSLEGLLENWEIWVADNNSSDRTVEVIKDRFEYVRLIENKENLGFAAACNKIAAKTQSEYLLFLNPDTRATPENLEKAFSELKKRTQIGVMTVKTFDEAGRLQKICYRFPTISQSLLEKLPVKFILSKGKKAELLLGDYFDHLGSSTTDWMYGAFMFVRRNVYEEAGGVPEDYFLFAEDLDFCYQVARKGFRNWYFADAEIVHQANKSAGQLPSEWRVERTVLSHYAFCFKNYGFFKTRLLQLIDLIGNFTDSINLRLKKNSPDRFEENKIYRKFILKAWRLNRSDTFELLKTRPNNERN